MENESAKLVCANQRENGIADQFIINAQIKLSIADESLPIDDETAIWTALQVT